MNVDKFVRHIESSDWYDGQIAHVEELSAREAQYAPLDPAPPERVGAMVGGDGITRFYTHQAEAIARARAGENVIVVTGTASGKTLCYNIPVLESLVDNSESRALYLYPTKALAQDQLRVLKRYKEGDGIRFEAGTYDGDTPGPLRRKLRDGANILLTNPDMLHSGILPNHAKWAPFFTRLRYVVVDEIHTIAAYSVRTCRT